MNKIQLKKMYIAALLGGMSSFGLHNAYAIETTDIDGLVRQAIQNHPLVGAAQAERQATTEELNAAELGVFPTPSVQTGYNINGGLTTAVAIRQPLWTGGKLSANIRQAYYNDQAAEANVADQRNQIAMNTVEAWKSYVEASGLQYIYNQTIQDLNSFQQMMQRRVDQGVSAQIELALVNNRLLQARNQYNAALEQKRIAQSRLQQIVGTDLQDNQQYSVRHINAMLRDLQLHIPQIEQQIFQTQGITHPAVVKAQLQTLTAQAQADAKLAERYPTIYAQYQYNYLHDTHQSDNVLGIAMTFEPGAGFSTLATSRATQARVQSYQQNVEAARRVVLENVQTQFQQLMSAQSRANTLLLAVDGAKIVTASYQRQFIAGRKSWLEVLNAVREQSDYQAQLVQNNALLLSAFYNLQVELGNLPWQAQVAVDQIAPAPQPIARVYTEYDRLNHRLNEYWSKRQNSAGQPNSDLPTEPVDNTQGQVVISPTPIDVQQNVTMPKPKITKMRKSSTQSSKRHPIKLNSSNAHKSL